MSKTIAFGEEKAEAISKGTPVKGGDCIWCDQPVWISSIGYFTEEPTKDIDAAPATKNAKCVHKLCFLDIMKTGQEVFLALQVNLKKRGLL